MHTLDKLNLIRAPFIKALRVKDMIGFARENFDIDKYLPRMKKGAVLDRTWIRNLSKQYAIYLQLVHSQIPLEFEEYIDKQPT